MMQYSRGTPKLLMQSRRTWRKHEKQLPHAHSFRGRLTRAPLSPMQQRASSSREMKRDEEMPLASAAAATWPILLSERERCWKKRKRFTVWEKREELGGSEGFCEKGMPMNGWKHGNLKARAGSYGGLQNEWHAWVHVVATDIKRQQRPALADSVENDGAAVLAEAVATKPQLLDDLHALFVCCLQSSLYVLVTLLARMASIKQMAASNFSSLLPLMLVQSWVLCRPSSWSVGEAMMAPANAAPTTPLNTLALASMMVLPTSSTCRGRPSLMARAIRMPDVDVKRQFFKISRRMTSWDLNICTRDSTAESLI
jgi:hypothetical protein